MIKFISSRASNRFTGLQPANGRTLAPIVTLLVFIFVIAGITAVIHPTAHAQTGGLIINNPAQYWVSATNNIPNFVTHHTFTSQYLKAPYNIVGINVYTPPGYESPQNQNRRYPVIYFLHGLNGDENNYFSYFPNLNSGLMGLIEGTVPTNLQMPEAIVVTVNGGSQSFYNDFTDQYHGPNSSFPIQSESIIINEVIPFVDSTYRTIANGSGRGIEGFSMGGRGALKMGLSYPHMFCSVISYAGAGFEEVPINNYYQGPHPYEERLSTIVATNQDAIIQNGLQIRLVVGSDDRLQQEPSQTLHAQLDACGISHEYEPSLPSVRHDYTQYYQVNGATGANFHFQCFQNSGALASGLDLAYATAGAGDFLAFLPVVTVPSAPVNPPTASCN